ncbi:MAG: hypothetical protein AAB737_01950, partial [Patescibacteria group bacterium]
MDWNVSSIPDNAKITHAVISLVVQKVDDDNNDLKLTETGFHGIDVPLFGESEFVDLLNGTYNGTGGLVSIANYNVSFDQQGRDDLRAALLTDNLFTHGIINSELNGNPD